MSIILTKYLAEKRIEARKNFPNAVWLPGDECPVGQKVKRQNGTIAIVIGEYKGDDPNFQYWWLLDDPEYKNVLEWPPCLDWPPYPLTIQPEK